ncbi:MAG TPA: CopG family transcriptional regulator [Acetobacteraceae bacterium]|nr:CopG family transcriptional regulator [Acetobacteraceae bacterium]
MEEEDRYTARITVNMTVSQRAELQRIARKQGVTYSWLLRRSLERTIEEANGGPMLPLGLLGPGAGYHG